jgi:signal transduction histidine kinase/PAS domain-containing protein
VTNRALLALLTLAVLAAAGAFAVVVTSDHVDGKAVTIALALPTGLAFIGSGLVARRRRPENGTTGLLLIFVGFTWFLAALPSANNAVLFTIGLAVTSVFIGFLTHLLLAFPSGKLKRRSDRLIAGAMYAVVCLGPLAVLLFDEGEIRDDFCDGPCPDNVIATVDAQPVANVLAAVYSIAAGALALAVAIRLLRRWRRASPALRRSLNPVFVTAGVVIAAFVVQILITVFSEEAAEVFNWVLLGAMLALPLGFLYGLMRPQLTAWSRRLAAELSAQRRPEEVQDVLRRALRDPTLEVGYRMPGQEGYVGVDARPLELPEAGSRRAFTEFGDEVVVHDASLRHQPELDEMLDAAHIALERGLSLRSLETSERRAQALIEAIPDRVYWVAGDGTCLACFHSGDPEPTGLAAIGFDRLVGSRIAAALPGPISDQLIDGLGRALSTGEVETVEFHVDEDGQPEDTEVRIVRAAPDEAVMIFRDVTERKRQERAVRALANEQAALSRVAVAVATETEPQRVFDVVTEEVGQLFRAQGANLARFEEGQYAAVILGRWGEAGAAHVEIGQRLIFDGPTPFAQVIETGGPVRLDTLEGIPGERAQWMRDIGVKSVVAAPVHVGGILWGAVVVSSTEYSAFAADAEERLAKFAALVSVAIANAEAREGLATMAGEQAALSRVAIAVATGTPSDRLFNVVTEEVGRLFGAEWAETARFAQGGDGAIVVGLWSRTGEYRFEAVGERLPFGGSALTLLYRTGRSARLDYETGAPEDQARMTELDIASAVAAPIFVGERLWGGITLGVPFPETFPADTEERLAQFTRLVGLAIVNAETASQLAASRARIVRAGDEERRRLERNLHDGAQQHLVTLSLTLRLAEAKLEEDPEGARMLLDSASSELAEALEELRELARGIHPAILSDRGLRPALEALLTRLPFPVDLDDTTAARLPAPVEAAAYYVVAESLTNVAKYAEAQSAQVRVARRNGLAIVEVQDDGLGGADASRGTGLRGLADRVEALAGRLSVTSTEGHGTRVRAEIPLEHAD